MSERPAMLIGFESSSDLTDLMKVLNEGSDLACVLVSTSNIDRALGALLEGFLIKSEVTASLLKPRALLSSFFAKSEVAYSLGLISKSTHHNLSSIGEIRNHLAHHDLDPGFQDKKVRGLVAALRTPSPAGDPNRASQRAVLDWIAGMQTRERYVLVAASTVMSIQALANSVERRPGCTDDF